MKIKLTILAVLILAVALVCCAILPGCVNMQNNDDNKPDQSTENPDGNQAEDDGHDWHFVRTVAPTCDKEGYDEYLCFDCYETTQKNKTDALGHTWELLRTSAPTCTEDGYDLYECSVCHQREQRNAVDALGHDFDFDAIAEDDYFTMAHCKRTGCSVGQRREPLDTLREKMVYKYTDEEKESIKKLAEDMEALLAELDPYDEELHKYVKDSDLYKENKNFEETYYDVFIDQFSYLTEQYQYAYVDYCVYSGDKQYYQIYRTIEDFREDMITKYYSLFREIYETKYREYFFDKHEGGWTDKDIQRALEYSDTYGDGEVAKLKKEINAIEAEYDKMYNGSDSTNLLGYNKDNAFTDLYARYVEKQNAFAKALDYDNYMDYAYAEVYDRDYTVEQARQIHDFVKKYISYSSLVTAATWYEGAATQDPYIFAFDNNSVLDSTRLSDLVGAYFAQMTCETSKKPINFFQTANEMFRDGNYFTGKYTGAFTWWVSNQDMPLIYLGPDSYSGAYTFVHEFGHYYNDMYNSGASLSMDLNETHSQGNEMLFSVFLKDYLKDKANPYTAEAIIAAELRDSIQGILRQVAVDEIEYIIYTGKYTGDVQAIKDIVNDEDGLTKDEYEALGIAVCESYGLMDEFSGGKRYPTESSYWRYVVVHSPGYYISYAMSMISSLEVWAKAEKNGLDAAKECYFKLFTFTDEDDAVEEDAEGDLVALYTYQQVLEYAGLASPFDEDTYETIGECLNALIQGTKGE